METGYYVRYDRGEGYEPIDIGELTSAQFKKFLTELGNDKVLYWAIALHKWIIENVEEVNDGK